MIKYLLHREIDFIKYDCCISKSKNSLIYGFSWYLDIVTENNWDVLVLNNYEAVMPLPNRKKYGINYIFQPAWVQQLGVFSNHEIKEDLLLEFVNIIPRKFKLIDALFNYDNGFSSKYVSKKDNFILDLDDTYQSLFRKVKKGRKSSIKQAQKLKLKINIIKDSKGIIDLFKENKGAQFNKSNDEYRILECLISKALNLKKVEIYEVTDRDCNLIGGAIFLINNGRLTYLFSATNQKGRDMQAISFLINHIIHKYSSSNMILDFEGSMILGIAKFFKSFGAVSQPYFYFRKKIFF